MRNDAETEVMVLMIQTEGMNLVIYMQKQEN
jgi:hypothetical protein